VAARFLTDPDQMRAMADRFDLHAKTVAAVLASDGAQMHWACRNVVTMLNGVHDDLVRAADRCEADERVSRELLGSLSLSA
jgi:hypothetical protein